MTTAAHLQHQGQGQGAARASQTPSTHLDMFGGDRLPAPMADTYMPGSTTKWVHANPTLTLGTSHKKQDEHAIHDGNVRQGDEHDVHQPTSTPPDGGVNGDRFDACCGLAASGSGRS